MGARKLTKTSPPQTNTISAPMSPIAAITMSANGAAPNEIEVTLSAIPSDSDSDSCYSSNGRPVETTITPPDSPVPWSKTSASEYAIRPLVSQNINTACSNLFLNDEYSDFSIIVGEGPEAVTFPAHRSVVCTQSGFFKLALRGGFKEAEEAIIRIPDESPKDIYRVLTYLYTNTYRDHSTSFYADKLDESDWGGALPLNAKYFHYATRTNIAMFRLADKYDIAGLGQLALDKQYAAMDHASMVYESCWAANLVYSTFEDKKNRMREVVGGHVLDGPLPEWEDLSGARYEIREIRSLIENHGDFAWKFVKKLYERIAKEHEDWMRLCEKNSKNKKERDEALDKVKMLEERVRVLTVEMRKWKTGYRELEKWKETHDPNAPPILNASRTKRARQE